MHDVLRLVQSNFVPSECAAPAASDPSWTQNDRIVRELHLHRHSIEIGRHRHCDLIVDDPEIPERRLLVQPLHGTVLAYDIEAKGRIGKPWVLPIGTRIALSETYGLVRVSCHQSPKKVPRATFTPVAGDEFRAGYVTVGRGRSARRLILRRHPVTIGSAPDNDLVLYDPTVAPHHCRLEPGVRGVLLRDLSIETGNRGSGTWIGGVRVGVVELSCGDRWRVGQTDLYLAPPLTAPTEAGDIFESRSSRMQTVDAEVKQYAGLQWSVWIHGESGVGKDRIAQTLHNLSARRSGPFVAINAAALPANLIESELFGHERGSFTGANAAHRGVFEQAHKGTLFIDEVAELSLEMQSRLLRVLDHWQVRRIGAEMAIPVDVRVLCASHRDLKSMVGTGEFRADLYYRLSQLVIEVPPLRQRPDDLCDIATQILHQFAVDVGPRQLSDAAITRLLAHSWPGNIRELRNVLCAAAIATPARIIDAIDVERAIARSSTPLPMAAATELQTVVERCDGNLAAAARALGIPRSTLRDRLHPYGRARALRGDRC